MAPVLPQEAKMLQIISGKFFTSNDLIVHEGLGIAYSNLRTYQSIKTCVASLEPADYSGSYVIKYTNQIEKEQGQRQGLLVRTGDTEIVDQFLLLCMFGLKAFFAVDRAEVTANCRTAKRHDGDRHLPSQFVPRYFDSEVGPSANQIGSFEPFVAKVISLKRAQYELTIRYLSALRDGLEALNYNIDLAYSMIVYAMEALSQNATTFTPTWSDYDPHTATLLEESFKKIDKSVADEIKSSLLQSSHLRLQQRFVSFITAHLSDRFFAADAPQTAMGLRPSVLPRALKNAYRMRSNFAHSLKSMLDQIRTPMFADGEVFFWNSEPYITLRGLLRIAEEVIRVYISKQESVGREDFAWRSGLPGIITVELAPHYWIGRHGGLLPEHAPQKLRGLLDQIAEILRSGGSLTDLRELMAKYEELIPQAQTRFKRAMIAAYWIYNTMVVPEGKRPNYKEVMEKHHELLEACSPENLAGYLIIARRLPWPVEDVEQTFREYQAGQFNERNVRIPRLMEIAIMAEIAKMHLDAGRAEQFATWMSEASREASGMAEWQNAIDSSRQKGIAVDWWALLDKKPRAASSNESGGDSSDSPQE